MKQQLWRPLTVKQKKVEGGKTFEFQVLCTDREACKRNRFDMETGLLVKPIRRLPDVMPNILGTPSYSKLLKSPYRKDKKVADPKSCQHDVSLVIAYDALRDKTHSLETECTDCGQSITLVNGTMEFALHRGTNETYAKRLDVVALVDFVHYEDYAAKRRKLRFVIDDKGEMTKSE